MKLLIFKIYILFFVIFMYPIEANVCSVESLIVLENCYASLFLNQLDFSFPYLAPNFVEDLKQDLSTSDGVIKRCKKERVFRQCLGKYTAEDVITNCINIESYLGLSFTRNVTKWARQYVTSFFETDYVCRNGYNTLVYFNDCINQIPSLCKNQNTTGCQNDYVSCMKETTAQKCGDAAGCFAFKDATISVCYDDISCNYCENLNVQNNFYDKLCNSDASFIPPSTTTVSTTSTTPDNSTVNIIVVTRP